jgi:hypothetical protein
MNSSKRFALALGISFAAGATFLACGGEDEPEDKGGSATGGNGGGGDAGAGGGTSGATASTGPLKFNFAKLYSAYDGTHKFQVPVSIVGNAGADFTVSDPSKVDVDKTDEGATLTIKGAGKVTVNASLKGQTGSVELEITEATPADWEAGDKRYNTSVSALKENAPRPAPGVDPSQYLEFTGSCTSCHGDTAKQIMVQHTPLQTAGYSDSDLITIFTMGMKPAGVVQRSPIPAQFWNQAHRWTVSEAEKKGLVVYLRSLAPKVQNEFDLPFKGFVDGGVILRDGAIYQFPADAGAPKL